MYKDKDIIFMPAFPDGWDVRCGDVHLGSVFNGDNYLVKLTDGNVFLVNTRAEVLEILLDLANTVDGEIV